MVESIRQCEVPVLDGIFKGDTSVKFWLPRVLALAASFIGPLPLLLDLKFHMGMSDTALVLWPLSVLLVISSTMLAARWRDRPFVKTVLVAIVAGYMATATYDSTRVAGMSAGVIKMDEALDFGQRLTGQTAPGTGHGAAHGDEQTAPADPHVAKPKDEHAPAVLEPPMAYQGGKQKDEHAQAGQVRKHDDAYPAGGAVGQGATVAIGYAWHYWAGIMFGLGFLVLFGARRWWWAIPYLVVVIYPGMVFAMGVHSMANFVWEAVGHAGFGLTLGIVSWALLGREVS